MWIADDDLVRAARAGDGGSRTMLFDRYRHVVAGICAKECKGRDDYDELLSEAYIAFDRVLRGYRYGTSFEKLLSTGIWRQIRNFRRGNHRFAARFFIGLDEQEVAPGKSKINSLIELLDIEIQGRRKSVCFRDTQVPLQSVVGMIRDGFSSERIAKEFPEVDRAAIDLCAELIS